MIKKILSYIARLILGICFIAQLILIYFIAVSILDNMDLGWLILCYIICELILHNYETSVTRMILSTIKKER